METMAKVGQITSYDAFYPTYKEWKLICRCYLVNAEFLFILPIRNGNPNLQTELDTKLDFLSYL